MNIIELAKEAGLGSERWNTDKQLHDFLERFANLVAANERETHRLPKLTDEQIWQCNSDGSGGYHICVDHQNVVDFARSIEREIGFDRANLWLKRIHDEILAEREACAKVCDDYAEKCVEAENWEAEDVSLVNAAAIRARGEK